LKEETMKRILGLLAVLGTLTILQPNGEMKLYATFPMGNQVSIVDPDTGRTWMIHAWGEYADRGDIIDYDKGEIYRWNYSEGCRKCGDWQRQEE
jgi:hypothetical protein